MIKITVYILALLLCISAINADQPAAGTNSGDASAKKDTVVECYVCNSNTDEGCNDPFKAEGVKKTKCAVDEKFCRKTVQYGE